MGINLVAANRAILMDISWNPANDLQAMFRFDTKHYFYEMTRVAFLFSALTRRPCVWSRVFYQPDVGRLDPLYIETLLGREEG